MSFLYRITFVVLLLLGDCVSASEFTVAVASNFLSPMKDLVSVFEAESNHDARIVSASSGKLYAQIKNGAPFDLFFSADQEKPILLEQDGLVVNNTRRTYAIGQLALWSMSIDLTNIGDEVLKRGEFKKIAIANPKFAPYGKAAVKVMENLTLTSALEKKIVRGENISQTFQFVSTGNAEIGFVALSQLKNNLYSESGSAWLVPREYYSPIYQDAVLLKSKNPDTALAALEFYEFLKSQRAKKIIENFSYLSQVEE